MKKYKYFIPAFGFLLIVYDVFFHMKNPELDKYSDDFMLALIFYSITVHVATIVGIGFLFIIDWNKVF